MKLINYIYFTFKNSRNFDHIKINGYKINNIYIIINLKKDYRMFVTCFNLTNDVRRPSNKND